MTKAGKKDVGASVRARLLRLAHARAEDFQLVLLRYANERLLVMGSLGAAVSAILWR